jgi:hypothetical protein
MSRFTRAFKQAGPVLWAGLSFLLYAAIAVPLGHFLGTTAMTASGLDTFNDGWFFTAGGVLSWILLTRKHHALSCTGRYLLELGSIVFGNVSYAIAVIYQPSTGDSLSLAIWSLAVGIVGVWMNYYWYRQIKPNSVQLGFRWNLLANYVGAGVLIPAGFIAWYWHQPSANYWAAVFALVVTLLYAVKPSIRLIRALAHHKENHDRAPDLLGESASAAPSPSD